MNFTQFLQEWSALVSIIAIVIGALVLRIGLKLASKRVVKTVVNGVRRVEKDERVDSIL